MLRLRKIELLGFKSFCARTTISFGGSGITCIVGPNGCGKSNIVDAISWVLGEQSHKSLRAERMADCISNGTAARPPMGMAEVSLALVDPDLAEAAAKVLERSEQAAEEEARAGEASTNTANPDAVGPPATEDTEAESGQDPLRRKRAAEKPAIQTKPGEVAIGRRLYRSGQSEYLINGRVVRLRDVQELFMGMGLGPDSYAIIEQGRIGQILSSKPMERRAILEEAAGISKYKTKRRLAEAKLESSKLNLSRVNDILVEVEKQLSSLKRQASKARRYAELREEMRELLRVVLASRAGELDAEAERLSRLLREIAEAEGRQNQALHQLEMEQERLGARNYELEAELRGNQNQLGECALELDRAENRIGFNRERMGQLTARVQQIVEEIALAEHQSAELAERARTHQASVKQLQGEKTYVERQLAALVEHGLKLSAGQENLEAQLEELRGSVGRFLEEAARLETQRAQAEQEQAQMAEALAQAEESAKRLEASNAEQTERARAAESRRQRAEARAQELNQRVRETQARIVRLRDERQETSAHAERARDEVSRARARSSSLQQILEERAYTTEAVQKLFAANGEGEQRGFRAVGLLADYAEVAEPYEGAVEQFLRDELESVVVETFDHARAGIALLRSEVGGRATFFVDSLHSLKLSPDEPIIPFQAEPGVISRLDRLVEFRGPLCAVAKRFLPRLGAAFLVETTAVAERLARDNPQFHFLTLDGTCYHGRLVSGGKPGEAGPLALKRELRSAEAEAATLEKAAKQAQEQLIHLEAEFHAQEQGLERSQTEHLEAERDRVAAAHLRNQAYADEARASQQLAAALAEFARLCTEAETARLRAERARERQTLAVDSRASAEEEIARATERLGALRQQAQEHQEQLSSRRAELATLAERLASAESVATQLADELREASGRGQSLREREAASRREEEGLARSTSEEQNRVESLRGQKRRLEEAKERLEQEWESTRTRSAELDEALRTARQQVAELRERRSQHEVEQARNESDRSHLRETCVAELNAQPEELIVQTAPLLAGEGLAAAEAKYREQKARIESMGPVNMMALEEYQDCEQRHDFLSRERDDLVKSIADTEQAIAELDRVSQEKFEEAFAAVNHHFAEAFRALFGGGTGEMRLSEPDSSGECGLDIVAQPPGKRLQNVLLLSGGEKALTALALLIAIFRYQPSPFCILDEVDAPLDEANVGRFNKMLVEMSEQTQFLVVTHNRRTMEMAPVLYGVTMQEPGVSKLVSVRWDEANPNAASAA